MVCPESQHWPQLGLGGGHCQVNLSPLTADPSKNKLLNTAQMSVCVPWNTSLSCYQHSSEEHGGHMQSSAKRAYLQAFPHENQRVLQAEAAVPIQPWIRRGHLPPAVLVPPPAPLLAKCIFHSQIRGGVCQETPKEDSGCSGSARQKADRQFLAPARQHPAMVGMDRPPQKCPCKVLRSLFSPPRADLKLILCTVPSPHINPTAAACQCGVWTEATLPCCCFPNICWHYCIALLWSFPVPPTTRKQYINRENPFNFEHTSYPMQLWPPRKRS